MDISPCPLCDFEVRVTPMAQFYFCGCGGCGLEPKHLQDTSELAVEQWEDLVEKTKQKTKN